ncbi:MAG: hypothetical protein Q9221_007911 [Calogaya cf. arnoldii]
MQLQSSPTLITILSLIFLLASPAAGLGKMGGLPKGDSPACWKDNDIVKWPRADAQTLATNLKTQSPDKLSYLRRDNSIYWEHGLFRLCVNNDFPTENTHVMRRVAGESLQKIIDKCCKPKEELCHGGEAQAKGDSDLFIDITTHNAGAVC